MVLQFTEKDKENVRDACFMSKSYKVLRAVQKQLKNNVKNLNGKQ